MITLLLVLIAIGIFIIVLRDEDTRDFLYIMWLEFLMIALALSIPAALFLVWFYFG